MDTYRIHVETSRTQIESNSKQGEIGRTLKEKAIAATLTWRINFHLTTLFSDPARFSSFSGRRLGPAYIGEKREVCAFYMASATVLVKRACFARSHVAGSRCLLMPTDAPGCPRMPHRCPRKVPADTPWMPSLEAMRHKQDCA